MPHCLHTFILICLALEVAVVQGKRQKVSIPQQRLTAEKLEGNTSALVSPSRRSAANRSNRSADTEPGAALAQRADRSGTSRTGDTHSIPRLSVNASQHNRSSFLVEAAWAAWGDTPPRPEEEKAAMEEKFPVGVWGRFIRHYVVFRLALHNIERSKLEANTELLNLVQAVVQEIILERVEGSHAVVQLEGAERRVVMICEVQVPTYDHAEEVKLMFHPNTTFGRDVADVLARVKGLGEITTAPIEIDGAEDIQIGYLPPLGTNREFMKYWWMRILNFEVCLVGIALLTLLCRYTLPATVDLLHEDALHSGYSEDETEWAFAFAGGARH